jgi:hypothetical protein
MEVCPTIRPLSCLLLQKHLLGAWNLLKWLRLTLSIEATAALIWLRARASASNERVPFAENDAGSYTRSIRYLALAEGGDAGRNHLQ